MKKIILNVMIGLLSVNFACAQKKADNKPNLPEGLYAVIASNRGSIYVNLNYKNAPLTVANFVGLAEGTKENTFRKKGEPYFDGMKFHRIVPDFVIQGGDPVGNGTGGPGYEFENEISPNLKHNKKGVIAMANSGPDTNGSQFYLTLKDVSFLDGSYSVFGETVQGLEVLDQIVANKSGQNTMDKVTIVRIGKEAQNFDAEKVFAMEKEKFKTKKEELAKIQKEKEKGADELIAKASTTASGLKYIIQKEGTGKVPVDGEKVNIHYTLTLKDGTEIDSSHKRYQPFEIEVGKMQLIQGWIEAIKTFKRGTKLTLIVPPNLGYGSQKIAAIPENSTLIFDMDILE
jgi:peptidyl-prolyl cis-trans isomerase A (cyclophilin A)